MRIAVINEFSTKNRNGDVLKALEELGYEPVNLGMKDLEGEPQLNYLETAFLSALALNLKAVDFVVGGCGTGQGYMNALLQYPGTFCGLLTDPTDAFLYSRINAGNCVSLPLNKGYGGVGGDINLKYIFEKLFNDTYGGGYPETRKEFQADLRKILNNLCNGVQREHNKKLNNGLPILHKVPPKRDYGRYFCIMAKKGGTSHGGLTEKLSPFFHA